MATEDWIQESLARLESLEEERNRHEAALETATDAGDLRMHNQAIERLEAKIRALYAELEAAAEASDEGDDEAEADEPDDVASAVLGVDDEPEPDKETRLFRREDVAAQAGFTDFNAGLAAGAGATPTPAVAQTPTPAPVAPTPVVAATPAAAPFGQAPAQPFGQAPAPVAAAANPFGGSPQPSPFGQAPMQDSFGSGSSNGEPLGFSAPASSFDGGGFDDDAAGGGGSKMGLIIGGVVVVGALAAYFIFGGKKETPPPAEPTGPAVVIKAGEVPPDTQGPKTVKGSDVDAIKGTQFKEGRPQPHHGGGGSHSSSSPSSSPTKAKKTDPRTKVQSADDPLAGIEK